MSRHKDTYDPRKREPVRKLIGADPYNTLDSVADSIDWDSTLVENVTLETRDDEIVLLNK